MNSMLHKKAKEIFLFCLFLFYPIHSFAGEFIVSDALVLDERAIMKMEEMGNELFKKTGVRVFLVAKNSGEGKEIVSFEKEFAQTLTEPFALLTLFLEEKKIDIYTSKELEKAFDKEVLLSPLPWKGMIIPLLTNKKKEVGVTPALLNGYAELVEQIAASRNVVLDSSIGNANKTTISLVKVLIYGFVGVLLLFVFIRRIRKNG